MSLLRLDLTVSEARLDCALGLLVRRVSFGWEERSLPGGETLFRLHTDNPDVLASLLAEIGELLPGAAVAQSAIENQDWTEAWRDFFTPVRAGRFVVLPPWRADEVPEGLHAVVIEPKSAFGTGHHATTALCLEALSRLLEAGDPVAPAVPAVCDVLDLGTGSGVLGIACATQGCRVTGVDTDPVAVANALENCALNGVAARMDVLHGSTEALRGRRFGLILANILAGPLCELAPDIKALLAPGGRLILSGILGCQADGVAARYTDLGEPERLDQGEWAALIW